MFGNPPPPSLDKNSNILKRLFTKYIDLDEQRFSEKMQIALKIMDIMFRTNQCTRLDNMKMKNFVKYTSDNINKSVYELDMMVNSNDKISIDTSKHTTIIVQRYIDEDRKQTERYELKLNEVQEILFITLHKVDILLNETLIKNDLLNYWD